MNGDEKNDGKSGTQSGTTLIERSIRLSDNRLDSRDLFVASREIIISHGEETYRLRLTAQNKLILTK
ncbi:MAG: hemin uptake protein HemP [Pseudomonadota bacterium]|jgi:hemin uptake protein HemP